MANRRLDPAEFVTANAILADLRARLRVAAGDDGELLFALRRKVTKELGYDERSKPMARRALKAMKRTLQNGLCARCGLQLPDRYCVLDRDTAIDGCTADNTQLICEPCDRGIQQDRGYA